MQIMGYLLPDWDSVSTVAVLVSLTAIGKLVISDSLSTDRTGGVSGKPPAKITPFHYNKSSLPVGVKPSQYLGFIMVST